MWILYSITRLSFAKITMCIAYVKMTKAEMKWDNSQSKGDKEKGKRIGNWDQRWA